MSTSATGEQGLAPDQLVAVLRELAHQCAVGPQSDLRTAAGVMDWGLSTEFTEAVVSQALRALVAVLPAGMESVPDPFETHTRGPQQWRGVVDRFDACELLEKAAAQIEGGSGRFERADGGGEGSRACD